MDEQTPQTVNTMKERRNLQATIAKRRNRRHAYKTTDWDYKNRELRRQEKRRFF